MVKIRLTRIGSKKNAIYRLVALDSRSPRDGRFLELLGFFGVWLGRIEELPRGPYLVVQCSQVAIRSLGRKLIHESHREERAQGYGARLCALSSSCTLEERFVEFVAGDGERRCVRHCGRWSDGRLLGCRASTNG